MALRIALNRKALSKFLPLSARSFSHYPIDESIFGLTDEQQEVDRSFLKPNYLPLVKSFFLPQTAA